MTQSQDPLWEKYAASAKIAAIRNAAQRRARFGPPAIRDGREQWTHPEYLAQWYGPRTIKERIRRRLERYG